MYCRLLPAWGQHMVMRCHGSTNEYSTCLSVLLMKARDVGNSCGRRHMHHILYIYPRVCSRSLTFNPRIKHTGNVHNEIQLSEKGTTHGTNTEDESKCPYPSSILGSRRVFTAWMPNCRPCVNIEADGKASEVVFTHWPFYKSALKSFYCRLIVS